MLLLNIKHFNAFFLFAFIFQTCFTQTYRNPNAPVESRVEDVLQNLTLQEKIDYIGGYNSFYIRAIDRLGLPELKMSDGPVGVRTWGNTTAYPAGILNAATWNTPLILKLGQALGEDARARGVHFLLGPGLNIYRAPMCGRNFEYFGEDPFLSGSLAKAYVNGVQSKNVVNTVKHFAGNNQEWDRYDVSSDIDERTLHEIYLPAFKAAVTQAHAGAVMTAYNLLNGTWCSQNHYLITDVLKTNWRFDGLVMSDWGATHNGFEAASAGLDLEMPEGDNMNYSNLLSLINNGSLNQSEIDDKVRRILRILFRFGFYDNVQLDTNIPLDDSLHATIALNLAREGIVLLKNADSLLPLDPSKIKSIAIIGPNADSYNAGGGSSFTSPFHYITIRNGIQTLMGSKINISFDDASADPFSAAANSVFYVDRNATIRGLSGVYYPDSDLFSNISYNRVDTIIDFHWNNQSPISNIPSTKFSIRWTGFIKTLSTGDYDFIVRGDDGFRLWVNNDEIINDWQDQSAATEVATVHLQADSIYPVKLEYYQDLGLADITFGWQPSVAAYSTAIQKASGADATIVCIGFNSNSEGEGFDRTFALPNRQDSLINAISKVNKNVIVILNAGGNVDMNSWLFNCKALLHSWYPGQEGGTAIAEILFGVTNPSGKLPASFEKKWADNPVYNNYYDQNGDKHVSYAEGLLLGYRYYDTKKMDPLFPFGFGLSYTQFQYSNLAVQVDTIKNNGIVNLSYQVKNIGSRTGLETSQVYIQPINPNVIRPFKELKGFNKVSLLAGETKTISFQLDSSSFSYYKLNIHDFGMDFGSYNILIGASSRDIRLQESVNLSDRLNDIRMKYSLWPANHSNNVLPLQNFRFVSDRSIYFDSNKSLTVKDSITGSVVAILSYLEGSGTDTLTFKNSVALKVGMNYYIEIDSNAIVDYFNHPFKGFYGPGNWDFSVIAAGSDINFADSVFEIYPNPASDHISFHYNESTLNIIKINLYNTFGQLVSQIPNGQLSSDNSSFSCSHFANGIYFCQVVTAEGILVRKFAIQKL
jgi:beta-glucosidase